MARPLHWQLVVAILSAPSPGFVLCFMRRSWSFRLLMLGATVLGSGQASAYVQNTTPITQVPHRWKERETITLRANAAGCADMGDDVALAAVVRAAESWNRAVSDCSYIRFEVREPGRWVTPKRDEEVAVVWVNEGWSDGRGHDPSMVALTVLWFVDAAGEPDDGRIMDADISLNDESYTFTVANNGDPAGIDLQSTLVHELGHVLGLDHSCYKSYYGPNPLPLDHLGRPIPRCSEAPPAVLESVMYPATRSGAIHRRYPSADDVAGICTIYPVKEGPISVQALELPGCSLGRAGGSPSGWSGTGLSLLLLGVAALRRRRRRGPATR